MTPDDLQPGMYLVGRDDGKVDPFFVKVEVYKHLLAGSCRDRLKMRRARFEPGWWWRRMDVPDVLPDQEAIDALPPFPMGRGK